MIVRPFLIARRPEVAVDGNVVDEVLRESGHPELDVSMLPLRLAPDSRHVDIFIVDEGHGGRVLQTPDAVGLPHNLYHFHTVQTELFPEVGGSEVSHLRLELKSLRIQTRPCFFVVLSHLRGAVAH